MLILMTMYLILLTRKKKKKDTKPKKKTSSHVPASDVPIACKSSSLFLNSLNFLSLQLLWKVAASLSACQKKN